MPKMRVTMWRNFPILLIFGLTVLTPMTWAEGGESASFVLDYGRMDGGASQSESQDYQLTGAMSDMSAEGESNTFTLHNVYAGDAATPVCGNGILEGGEQCDGGDFGGLTCQNFGFNAGNLQCQACSIVTNTCFNQENGGGGGGGGGNVFWVCGNGIVNGNEQCDDGNQLNGDGCSSSCLLEGNNEEEIAPEEDLPQEGEDENNAEEGLDFNPQIDPELGFPFPETGDGISLYNTEKSAKVQTIQTPEGEWIEVLTADIGSMEGMHSPAEPEEPFHLDSKEIDPHETNGWGASENPIIILDETPLLATQVEPEMTYTLSLETKLGKVVYEDEVTSNQEGKIVKEVEQFLDYDTYHLTLKEEGKIVREWWIKIEDLDYRPSESVFLNHESKTEWVDLGTLNPLDIIGGKGESESHYHAYFIDKEGRMTHFLGSVDEQGNYAFQLPEVMPAGHYDLHILQVYPDGKISANTKYHFNIKPDLKGLYLTFSLIALALIYYGWSMLHPKRKKRGKSRVPKTTMAILIALGVSNPLWAVDSTPALIIYEGKLLDSNNDPIITSHSFRFSIWSSDDLVAGDILGDGSINAAAPNYGGWQEVHTLTPNADGTFFVELGKNVPLGAMNINTHLDLQVEIKAAIDPDTSYELMDPTGDNGADTDDRQTMGSTPYVNNADFVDNTGVGTSAGDLAALGAGDKWDISFIPEGTNQDGFTLDHDNTAGPGDTIDLVFGDLLAETIRFDIDNDWFDFSNDIYLNQNQIKNFAIDNLNAAPGAPVAGQIYHNTVDGNTYIWNGAIWEDITATGGGGTAIAVFNAEYEDSAVQGDGSNNKGVLSSHFVDDGGVNKYNYYEWLSSEATLQDVDVYISFKLPENFGSFTGTPLSLLYQTGDANTANNQIDVELFDSNGDVVALVGGTDLANAAWTTAAMTFGGGPVFTAGQNITLKIKLNTSNAGLARIADIVFQYNQL